jgi:ribonuclease HI
MSTETPSLKATLYTDGGCRGHSSGKGFAGWGYHGQIGDYVYDGWGSIEELTTNNVAEMVAVKEAIEVADQNDVDNLTILSDSRYVIDGINDRYEKWEANNWLRYDGEPVKNRSYWESLANARAEFTGKGNQVTFKWTKGHSGNPGNDAADRNATKGVMLSTNGHHVSFHESVEKKKYGKVKAPNYNRLFCHNYWYFNTNVTNESDTGHHVYYCGNHEILGKPESDAGHSILYLKDPDKVLETLRDHQNRFVDESEQIMFTGHLTDIFSSKNYSELYENGTIHTARQVKTRNILSFNKQPFTSEVRPVGRSFYLLEVLGNLEERLKCVIRNELPEQWRLTDVTDKFYNKVTKGKGKNEREVFEFSKTLPTGVKAIKLDVEHGVGLTTGFTEVTLTFGVDIPSRNALAALPKVVKRISILTWPSSKTSFNYGFVVETEDDIGIWACGYANTRII